jgi:hypothetical protein
MINSKMIKKLLLIYLIALAHLSNAQSKIDYSQLRLNDSVRVQTVYGSFYYGLFLAQTDSLLSLHLNMMSDTLQLVKKQIYELEVLSQQPPVAETQQQPNQQAQQPLDRKGPIAAAPNSMGIMPLSGGKKFLQVAAGTSGLLAGTLGGALAGGLIFGALSGDWTYAPYSGAAFGAISGSMLLSSYMIYSIGNTKDVKGKYWVTVGGVLLGTIGSIVFPPIILVAPALVGTWFYNSSRYVVPKPSVSGFMQPIPNTATALGMGDRPVFQVNLLTLTF